MEKVTEGIILVRATDNQIIDANPAAAHLAGYETADLQSTKAMDIFPADASAHWLKEVRALGQASLTSVSLRRKSGTTVFIDIEATTIRQGRDKIIQLILRPVSSAARQETQITGVLTPPMALQPVSPVVMPPTPYRTALPVAPIPAPVLPVTAPVQRSKHPEHKEHSTLYMVLEVVAKGFGVPVTELTGSRNTPDLTLARRVAMYLAVARTGTSATETGQVMGGRSDIAVTYGVRFVADALEQDWALRRRVEEMLSQLGIAEPAAQAQRV
jgi:PAS domain S-box-containing protein